MRWFQWIESLTALWRSIELRNRNNLAIVALAGAVFAGGVIYMLATGTPWQQAAVSGIWMAAGVFLAWACARELDPDHSAPALVAAGLALVLTILLGLANLLALLWVLLVMRLLNRTTGAAGTTLDALAILLLGAWLTLQGNWTAGLVTSLAFWLDTVLPDPAKRRTPFAIAALALTLVLAVAAALLGRQFHLNVLFLPSLLAALAVSALFVLVILSTQQVDAVGDRTGQPLSPRRVQAGQGIAVAAGLLAVLWQGVAGITTLLPLWSAIIATVLGRGWLAWRSR